MYCEIQIDLGHLTILTDKILLEGYVYFFPNETGLLNFKCT